MPSLQDLLDTLQESITLSTAEEIKTACALIIQTQELTPDERDTLAAAYKAGPLFDGDVPSKGGRDSLISKGLMVKVVVKQEDGFNACTNKGAWAYRLICAGA